MNKSKNKKIIIVLGMHRSGTSAVAGFLNRLGIPFGSNLQIPNEFNEKGYFENTYIVIADDNILQILGSSWDDPFLFEEYWHQSPQLIPHKDNLKNIIHKEFDANELFCIKDPRISILLPLWVNILQELNIEIFFIIPLRHPIEVAESLKARDGFSIQKGLILWMNNMLSIEYYSRPFKRSFFIFDEFLKSPNDIIHRILNKFDIVFPNMELQVDTAANELLDPKLKHYHIQTLNSNYDMLALIKRLNAILFDHKNNIELDENDRMAIDEIRGEYKKLNLMFYNQDIKNISLSLVTISAEYNVQRTKVTQAMAEYDSQINRFNQAMTECEDQIARLNQAAAEREDQIVRLKQAVAERDSIIGKIFSSFSWRLTRPLRILKTFF